MKGRFNFPGGRGGKSRAPPVAARQPTTNACHQRLVDRPDRPRARRVGAENSITSHAARSYSWISPPRTSRLITDRGGASEVTPADLGAGGLISSERWG